jgi:hypothetical protein
MRRCALPSMTIALLFLLVAFVSAANWTVVLTVEGMT